MEQKSKLASSSITCFLKQSQGLAYILWKEDSFFFIILSIMWSTPYQNENDEPWLFISTYTFKQYRQYLDKSSLDLGGTWTQDPWNCRVTHLNIWANFSYQQVIYRQSHLVWFEKKMWTRWVSIPKVFWGYSKILTI